MNGEITETLGGPDPAGRPWRTRRSRRPWRPTPRLAAAGLLVVGLLAALAIGRLAGQPSQAIDVTSGRAVLDGLGVPVPRAVPVSERVYRPCADDACAEVVRTFATTGEPSLRTVVGELGDWATRAGLSRSGPWACGVVPGTARTAAPAGDCAATWRTPDGVEVEVHVRLPAGAVGEHPWTAYAGEQVLLVWDAVAA